MLLGSKMSQWVPMTLLAAMAAVDLLAQYTVAATDLPQLLGISGRIIRFLQVPCPCRFYIICIHISSSRICSRVFTSPS